MRRYKVFGEVEYILGASSAHAAADAVAIQHPDVRITDVCGVDEDQNEEGDLIPVLGRCESCGATVLAGDDYWRDARDEVILHANGRCAPMPGSTW